MELNSLRCLYTNANSLGNKHTELRARIQDYQPHIVGITEVWTKEQFSIEGYHPAIHKHRANDQAGGGVLLLVCCGLDVQECEELNAVEFEDSVWCMVRPQNMQEQILVGVCYRSPSSNEVNNNKLIKQISWAVEKHATSFLLMGDFNYSQINWESGVISAGDESPSSIFYQSMHDNFLCQHVLFPTRYREGFTPSCLDLIFTKRESDVEDLVMHDPLGKSDHVVLVWELALKTKIRPSVANMGYNFHQADYEGMRSFFSKQDWREMANLNIEPAWEHFKTLVHTAVDKYVPKHTHRKKKSQTAPWWNSTAERAVKAKYKAWKVYSESNQSDDYKAYTIQRNKTLKVLRAARQDYEKGLVQQVKADNKKLYRYIRKQQKVKAVVGNLEKANGLQTESDKEAADALQEFFESVFVKEGDLSIPEFPDKLVGGAPICNIEFTYADILTELQDLKEDKSTGLDGIGAYVLKHCAHQLVQPLKIIFTKSMNERTLPSDWKKARITPIFKKGRKKDVSNYRPVSITSQTCKIMERILRKRILQHLEENDLLSSCQHGFMSKKSCLTNLLESLEDWTAILDEGKALDIIFLDLSKAFDTVPSKRLMKKLHCYGIQGNVHGWLEDFLTGRQQLVTVGASCSKWGEVVSGVPQGSVLGPILFLLYVNDMPSGIGSSIKVFADDTKIYRAVPSIEECEELQRDLTSLEVWAKDWLLQFNTSKCKVMHCGASNLKYEYCMNTGTNNATVLQKMVEEKDLGVTLTNSLKPTVHCEKAARKAMSALRLLRTSFSRFTQDNFKILFTTYVRPHLEYCLQAVGPFMRKNMKALERIQRRATKNVRGLKYLPYEERLQQLSLLKIEERARRGDLIETYKIMTGKLNVDPGQFFTKESTSRTRGHHLKLIKPRSRGLLRSKFFSRRVVDCWNQLPAEVVSAVSTNSFKAKLDKFLCK